MGATSAIIIGAFHYSPIFTGTNAPDFLALTASVLFCFGVNGVFLPMHSVGVEGIPRRYINYDFLMASYNKFIGLSLLVTLLATFLLFFSLKFFAQNFLVAPSILCNESFFGCPVKWHSFEHKKRSINLKVQFFFFASVESIPNIQVFFASCILYLVELFCQFFGGLAEPQLFCVFWSALWGGLWLFCLDEESL